MHVVRLMKRLDDEGITSRVFNRSSDAEDPPRAVSILHRQKRWFLHFALTSPDKLLLVFTGRPLVRFLAYLLKVFRGKRYILRVGEERIFETFRSGGWLPKWMTRVALRKADEVILVSPHFVDLMLDIGVSPDKISVIPGFIPPIDLALEPSQDVIRFAKTHSPVLSANGQLCYERDGDIYGIEILIEAVERLKESHPSIGLLLSLYDSSDTPDQLRQELERRGIAENVFVRSDPHQFWPILKYADVFVRPTRTEGDSNSIREAFALGVPVVASDPVPRPEPCVLFEDGRAESLAAVLGEVLAHLAEYREVFQATEQADNAGAIVELIKKHLE